MKPQNHLIWCALSSTTTLLASAQSAQELINSVLNPAPGSEHYSSYSSEIYYNHTLYNQTPIASTNYDKVEASAKLLLPPAAYDYAAGGAELEKTVAANREAFDHVGDSLFPIHLESIQTKTSLPVAYCPPCNAPSTPFSQPQHRTLQPHAPRPHRHGSHRCTNTLPPDR